MAPIWKAKGPHHVCFFFAAGINFLLCFCYLVESRSHFETLYIYVWVGLVVGMVVAIKGLHKYIVTYRRYIFCFIFVLFLFLEKEKENFHL